jgi:hypothetical protein
MNKGKVALPKHKILTAEPDMIVNVPQEFRDSFEQDLLNSLRDIAGVSTTALHPFIMEPAKVAACFGGVPSIFSTESCDLVDYKLSIYPKRLASPNIPRWVHLDLAVTSDSAGMAIGHVTGFVTIERGEDKTEILPTIRIDAILEICPPRGGEINFEKIRNIIYTLTKMGMNVKWVSADSYQSRDTLQLLRQKGYVVGIRSLDKDTHGYDITKQAFYDGRIVAPSHAKCLDEFVKLERDIKKAKIDHRPNGSKDCSDAVAGVVAGLSLRRENWIDHGVDMVQLPDSLKRVTTDERTVG